MDKWRQRTCIGRVIVGAAWLVAQPAFAGDTPVYAVPAAWVKPAAATAALAKAKGTLVIYDKQISVDGATAVIYSDTAARIDSPASLNQYTTLALTWLPDKGDLVVHRVELLRDGAAIDLLKTGKFEVLRREQQLEQRELTGMLTASMQIVGARVGDVLRVSYSTSATDKALAGNVQAFEMLPYFPDQPGFGRLTALWHGDRAITATAGPRTTLPATRVIGPERLIAVDLPRPKPPEMPGDAPSRYRQPTMLRLTSFADWQDVSRTMAPLFATEGTIAKDGPVAAEVARIAASITDPVARMTAALRLVQDRIAYFANGMNGGNYVPQSPAQTWTTRQGDCKAKTLLLLAMLRGLGITGEALLVNATAGDGVPEWGPMPSAFNHVIVHATLAGREYWLDGTGAGTRQASIGDVPPFRWGLPLRVEGAGLIPLPATIPAKPAVTLAVTFDDTFGVDMPMLFDARLELAGPFGAAMQQLAAAPAGQERDDAIDAGMANVIENDPAIYERSVSYDPATGIGTITARGMANSPWARDAKRPLLTPRLPSRDISFAPDRGRTAWQQIPVELGAPSWIRVDYTMLLPDGGKGMTIDGAKLHDRAVGYKLDREATLQSNKLAVSEDLAAPGGELPADAIAAERAKLATLAAGTMRVRGSVDARRRWDVRTPQDRRALQPLEAAYARFIAARPDKAERFIGRASFKSGIADYAGALADLNSAIALDGDADTLTERSRVYLNLGDPTRAIADLRKARDLDPSPTRIARLAEPLGRYGKPAEALALIEPIADTAGDAKLSVISVRADLLAELGRKDEGVQAFDALLAERPGDGDSLNAVCFYRAAWNVGPEAGLVQCNQALQGTNWSPAVLDSRAFINFRLGKLDAALADANAALDRNPAQTETLLLRGVIKRKGGDTAGGTADIAEALRRAPLIGPLYKLYGVLP